MSTHSELILSKKQLNGQSVQRITRMSTSEVVVIESIEVRELLRFLILP